VVVDRLSLLHRHHPHDGRYGDLSPTSASSKLFSIFLVLVGIGVIVAFVERVARLATEDVAERKGRRKRQG